MIDNELIQRSPIYGNIWLKGFRAAQAGEGPDKNPHGSRFAAVDDDWVTSFAECWDKGWCDGIAAPAPAGERT